MKIFLNKINIKYTKLLKRMTRDFEIQFESSDKMHDALNILRDLCKKK